MLGKERLSHDVACHRSQLLFLLPDRGELNFLFARDRFFWERGIEQDVRKQIQAQFHIGLHDVDRHAEAVVTGVTRNRTADCFDLVGDLLGSARLRSLQQHLRHQTRDAICLRCLGEKTAAKNCAHSDEWQPGIFAHQHSQSVW